MTSTVHSTGRASPFVLPYVTEILPQSENLELKICAIHLHSSLAAMNGVFSRGIPLANSKMSDKLQFVVAFGSGRVAETSDKLKFVGHFQRHFALLPSLPAVSPAPALHRLSPFQVVDCIQLRFAQASNYLSLGARQACRHLAVSQFILLPDLNDSFARCAP